MSELKPGTLCRLVKSSCGELPPGYEGQICTYIGEVDDPADFFAAIIRGGLHAWVEIEIAGQDARAFVCRSALRPIDDDKQQPNFDSIRSLTGWSPKVAA